MDTEVGKINKEDKNLGKMDAEGGEFNEVAKNLEKSLKRPIEAIDDDDDDDDSDDSLSDVISDEDLICRSDLENIFEHPNFMSVSSRLEGEGPLVELFENILEIVKRENISSGDADEFTNVVKQVLSIIIAYCVAEMELTEIFDRCRDDEQLRKKYGLRTYFEF